MKRKVIDKASFIEHLARLPGKYYTEAMFNVYFKGNFKEIDILDKQEEKIVTLPEVIVVAPACPRDKGEWAGKTQLLQSCRGCVPIHNG